YATGRGGGRSGARGPGPGDRLCCAPPSCREAPMTYAAPLADMRLTLDTLGGLTGEAAESANAILDEAARFAAAELAPLNQPADRVGSVLENGVVRTPSGFRDAY